MSNTTRRIRKRIKARQEEREHQAALSDVQGWDRETKGHFLLTVGRLQAEGMALHRAELAAYRAIVKGLQGREIGAECIPPDFVPTAAWSGRRK
jgi:hypothetical protein